MASFTNLSELNAAYASWLERQGAAVSPERFGLTLRREYAVGRAGQQQGRRGTAGAKLHLLSVERITAEAEPKAGRSRVGDFFSIQGCVSSNGQFTGTVVAGAELASVNCSRCQATLVRLAAILA